MRSYFPTANICVRCKLCVWGKSLKSVIYNFRYAQCSYCYEICPTFFIYKLCSLLNNMRAETSIHHLLFYYFMKEHYHKKLNLFWLYAMVMVHLIVWTVFRLSFLVWWLVGFSEVCSIKNHLHTSIFRIHSHFYIEVSSVSSVHILHLYLSMNFLHGTNCVMECRLHVD